MNNFNTMDLTNHSLTSSAISFTENQHGTIVLGKLYEQLADSKYCDVILHVQDKAYSAHRCVLASCSPYFENMFKDSTLTSDTVTVNCQIIPIFETVFTYMYTGKIVIDLETVSEVLRLGNQFMLAKLKGYCAEYLERSVHVSNVYFIKDIAEKWGLAAQSKMAHAFILANLLEVVEQDELLHFDSYKLEGMISNRSFPLTEELKIHMICRWVAEDIIKRHKSFQQLMGHIQWVKLNVQALYNMIQSEKLFNESEYCMWVILTLLQERGILLHIYAESLKYLDRKVQSGMNMEQILLNKLKEEEQRDPTINVLPSEITNIAVQEESENKLVLVENVTNTEDLTMDENSDDIPVDTGFSSEVENDPDSSGHIKETESLTTLHNLSVEGIDQVEPIKAVEGDISDPQQTTELLSSKSNTEDDLSTISVCNTDSAIESPERDKHKRKGQPVKLTIAKSRISMPSVAVPKKKGRPPSQNKKKKERKKVKKRLGRPKRSASLVKSKDPEVKTEDSIKQPKDEKLLDFDEEDDDERLVMDDSDLDESYSPSKVKVQRRSSDVNSKKERSRGKRGCKKSKESPVKQEKVLACEYCSFKSPEEDQLMEHLEDHHHDCANYSCSKCGFESLWNKKYYRHMKSHFSGPPFKCDNEGCDYVSERVQPLLVHRMRHTDERPFACTVCGMKFRTKNNLTTHMRCHTGEKPWVCDVCHRCFATKGTLEQHSVTHSEVRPYLCDTCGFSTKYQSHLIAHKRIHTGDVFRCQYPSCKYSTPKRSQLACHMRSHMSIRQHICSVCSRAFVEKSHLVRHERIHLDDKPFKCKECDYSSTRRDKLKEHVNKYHGETAVKGTYKPRKPRKQTYDPQAFPEYSLDCAMKVQEEFNGQMEKSVQQRNIVHAQIKQKVIKPAPENTDTTTQASNNVPTPIEVSGPEFTQLKNVLIQSPTPLETAAINTGVNLPTISVPVTSGNSAVTAGINYSDSIPMVIDPSSVNNIQLAFTNLGFVQPQNLQQMLNPVQVTTAEHPQQQTVSQDSSLMVSYSGAGASIAMPAVALSGTPPQAQAVTTTDLSQLQTLMGGFLSGMTNV